MAQPENTPPWLSTPNSSFHGENIVRSASAPAVPHRPELDTPLFEGYEILFPGLSESIPRLPMPLGQDAANSTYVPRPPPQSQPTQPSTETGDTDMPIDPSESHPLDPNIIISNLKYLNRTQANTISNTNYHANLLWHRFNAKDHVVGMQAYKLSAWEAKAASLDEREARLKREVEFKGDRASQLPEKSASDQAANFHKEKESSDSSTLRELKATMGQFMTRLTVVEAENKDLHTENLELKVELTEMKLCVTVLQDKVNNLEEYQQTTNPVFIIRIQIRTLMDKIMALLFTLLTGITADERGNNVRSWWVSGLNPPSSRTTSRRKKTAPAVMDVETLNRRRLEQCIALLKAKGLATNREYTELIDSGALAFLTQSVIQLRVWANDHAHKIPVDVPNFRVTLSKVKEADDDICSDEDFACINGLLDFMEASNMQM